MTRKSGRSNKGQKSDSSKSGDTTPGKINMAVSISQQQQQVGSSQILAQAHDSIYRSQQGLSGSPVMPQPKLAIVVGLYFQNLKYLQRQDVRSKLVYDQIYVNGRPYKRQPWTSPQRDSNTEPMTHAEDNYSDTTERYTSDLFRNKLNITYLNVCGLKSKLLNPDFVDIIKNMIY